jgi:hypothetical protein
MSSPSSRIPASVWTVDPEDPRAPPEEVWDALSPAERKHIIDSLPSEFPYSDAQPPEGDAHFKAKTSTRDVLDGFFARVGRRVYVACELPVYYPGERHFAPDVLAVVDVATHEREKWIVKDEGKGLDLAIEVLVSGRRRKDLEENVERYAPRRRRVLRLRQGASEAPRLSPLAARCARVPADLAAGRSLRLPRARPRSSP